MHAIDLVLLILATTVALCVLSQRLKLPQALLLVVGGVVLACLPGLPAVRVDPDLVFQVFVPPLLYRAATQTSLLEFRRRIAGIAFLSFTMVLATMGAVAIVAHAVVAGLGWDAAFALGAIVAPPDSVAALSFTRSIPLPRGVVTLLQGEGLVNDAAAFVSYRMAVAAMVTGTFSIGRASSDFLFTAVVGVMLGLGVGWAIARLRERLRDLPVIDNTVSFLTPFLAFVPAERLGVSSLLAVTATGLFLGRWAPRSVSPVTRLQANVLWDTIVFLLEALIFVLLGYELPGALLNVRHHEAWSLALGSGAVAATVILSRLILVGIHPYVDNAVRHLVGASRPWPSWGNVLLVGWAGVRGGDSLIIALALPMTTAAGLPLPSRDVVIFITIAVIVITFVIQGLSFSTLTRWLGTKGDGKDQSEERLARDTLRQVAESCIRAERVDGHIDSSGAERMRALLHIDAPARETARFAAEAVAQQRRALLGLYEQGQIGDTVMRRLLQELDLQASLASFRSSS